MTKIIDLSVTLSPGGHLKHMPQIIYQRHEETPNQEPIHGDHARCHIDHGDRAGGRRDRCLEDTPGHPSLARVHIPSYDNNVK